MQMEMKLGRMPVQMADEIQYFLKNEDGQEICLNDFVGKKVSIEFANEIRCVVCDRKTKKAFGQGFCYPCFMDAPENSPCILRPELCEAHLGKGRDVEWEEKNHLQVHHVYLAKSSAIKVGITRSTQIPTRWIDQGASQAVIIATVPYRKLAGDIEVALKAHFTDKTSWQRMLKNEQSEETLGFHRQQIKDLLPEHLHEYLSPEEKIWTLNFPVEAYPEKVKSVKLEKEALIEGTLLGVKGQYIILDGNRVMNIRSHSGYIANVILE